MALFQKFPWQQTQLPADDEDDEKDLFSHSKNYLSVAKEKAEREKRNAEKAKTKEERKKVKSESKERKAVKRESDEHDRPSSSKKAKRITSEESKKLLAKATAGFINISDSDDDGTPCPEPKPKPGVRRSPRTQRTRDALSPQKPKSKLSSIALEDDDDGLDDFEITSIVKRPAAPPPPEEEEDSDPELAALKRKAREKRKQQQKCTPNVSSASPGAQVPTPPPAPDPVIQILVTSEIPETKPLICCRKISQNLEPVRDAWVKKQEVISPQVAPTIFLTHCGRKLFNTTLVKRLGLVLDPTSGGLYLEGDELRQPVDKIHIEAMTPELFDAYQKRQAEQAKASASAPEPTGEEEQEAEELQQSREAQAVRITINTKGRDSYKLRVFPDTPISKILRGCRKHFKLDETQEIYLEFDGDQLEPDSLVGDSEIEDLFQLNLYIS